MSRIKSRGGAHAAKMQFVRMPMWKCIISLVLAFTLAVSLGTNWAYAAEFLPKPAEPTQVPLNQTDQDKTVSATEVEGATGYVWQAQLLSGGYANIESSHEATLHIDAGLIDNENFLTADNKVMLRSFAVDENGEWFNREDYVVNYNRNAQAAGQAANTALGSAVESQEITYLDAPAEAAEAEATEADAAEADADEPANAHNCTLTLNFVNEDGTQLALPVTNVFDTDKAFKWEIQLKEYLGTPQSATPTPTGLVEAKVDPDNYKLTITRLDKYTHFDAVTIKVVSGQATASYTVWSQLQKLDGDWPPDTDWKKYVNEGKIGSDIPTEEDLKVIEPGGILLGQVGSYVTMDGLAEASVRYLRAYRLINFNPNGGIQGPDPIYDKYGASVTKPGLEPHRSGYNFLGWFYEDGTPVKWDGLTIPEKDITVYAHWQAATDKARVIITYYGENAEVDESLVGEDYFTKNYAYLSEQWIDNATVGAKYTLKNSEVVPVGEDPNEDEDYKNLYVCSSKAETKRIVNDGAVVTPDGYTTISVYLVRNQYQWDFVYGNNWGTKSSIKARWGQNIHQKYLDICKAAYGQTATSGKWCNYGSPSPYVYEDKTYTNFLVYMDRQNRTNTDRHSKDTRYAKVDNDAKAPLRYYLQTVDGKDEHALYTDIEPEAKGNYKMPYNAFATEGYNITSEEFIKFDGFITPEPGSGYYEEYWDAPADHQEIPSTGFSFFYKRAIYDVTCANIRSQTESSPWTIIKDVRYERPLAELTVVDPYTGEECSLGDYIPTIPKEYDQNFVFKGWCFDQNAQTDPIDIDTYIMPSHAINLYAKWGPPEVTITFDTSTAPQEVDPDPTNVYDTIYGTEIDENEIPAENSSTRYRFTSWYSLTDPGKPDTPENRTYFNPHEMPAPAHNITLFMEYYDNNMVTYKVNYVYIDTEGGKQVDVDVAAPTNGAGVPGTKVHLEAKEGSELYPDFQLIYEPNDPATFDMTLNQDQTKNVHTFYYDKTGKLEYTVRYVVGEGESAKDIINPVKKTVKENVAYEEALAGSKDHPEFYNYTLAPGEPNAKSIVLEQDAKNNVIIFHYTENTVDITYKVYVADTDYGYITAHGSDVPSETVVDTVKVLTDETANGATAYVNQKSEEGYEFDGWYYFNIKGELVKVYDDADFQPEKPAAGWSSATYFARFKTKTLEVTFDVKTFQREEPSDDPSGIFVVSGGKVGQSTTEWTELKKSTAKEILRYNMPYDSIYRYGELGFGSTTMYFTNLSDPEGEIDFSEYDIVRIETISLLGTKYKFEYWSQDPTTETPTIDQKIKVDTDFFANYDYVDYNVYLLTDGNGGLLDKDGNPIDLSVPRVVPYDELIFITDSKTPTEGDLYPEGGLSFSSTTHETIDVTPNPNANYKFSKWTMRSTSGKESEALVHNKEIPLSSAQPKESVEDIYLKIYFDLDIADATFNVNPKDSGEVSTPAETFVIGTTYAATVASGKGVLTFREGQKTVKTVTATPANGYHFVNWTLNKKEVTTGKIETAEQLDFIANFAENDPVTYTYVPVYKGAPTTDKNVGSVNPESQDCLPVSGVGGKDPSSTATAGAGYNFEGWYVSDGAGGYTKVGSDATITIGKVGGVYTGGTYYANFVAKDQTVEIKYAPITWLYNASSERVTKSTKVGGTVTPDKETVNIVEGNPHSTAAAKVNPAYPLLNTGYTFLGWYDGEGAASNLLSSDATYNPQKSAKGVFEAKTYYAHFMEKAPVDITYKSYTLTYVGGKAVYTPDGKGGLVNDIEDKGTAAITYKETGIAPDSGQPKGSLAKPNNGYHFVGWAFYYPDGDYTEALSDQVKFVPSKLDTEFWTANVEYAAVFTENAAVSYEYKVKTIGLDGEEILGATGGKVVPTGETVAPATGTASGSLATANPGYKFVNWIDDKGEVAKTPQFTPQKVDGAYTGGTYTAVFQTYEITVKFAVNPAYPESGSITPDTQDIKVESTTPYTVSATGVLSIDGKDDHSAVGVDTITVYSMWKTGKQAEAEQTQSGFIIEQDKLSDNTPVMYFWAHFMFTSEGLPINYSVSPYADANSGYVKLNDGSAQGLAVQETVHQDSDDPAIGCLAVPAPGYHFAGWYMDDESHGPYSNNPYIPTKVGEEGAKYWESHWYYAYFEEDAEVTVNYVAKSFLHDGTTASTVDGGSVTLGSEDIAPATGDPDGSQGTVNAGFSFAGWYTNEACTTAAPGDSKNLHYTPIKDATEGIFKAATYYAKFVENESVTITYKVSDPNGGSIALQTTNNDQADQVSETVAPATGTAKGAVVTLNPGYHVEKWIDGAGTKVAEKVTEFTPDKVGDLNVAGTYTCVIAEDPDVTISYAAISFLHNGTTPSTVSGGKVDPQSEDVAPATGNPQGSTGTAIKGFTFVGWFVDEAGTTPAPGTSTTAKYVPQKDTTAGKFIQTTYYAKFVENEDVTINYAVATGETHRGSVDVDKETKAPVTGKFDGSTATPAAGYDFAYWTKDAGVEPVGTNPKIVPTKSAEGVYVAATYYAHFSPRTDTTYKIKYALQNLSSIGKTTLTEADFEIVETATEPYTGITESTIDPYNGQYAKPFTGFYLYPEGSTFDSGKPFVIKGDGTSYGVRFYARNSDTQYTVVHWQQDLNAETFTQVGSEVNKDYTGKTIDASTLAHVYEGFTYSYATAYVDGEVKITQTFEVLADGSQVVNLYYTRNSYDYTVHYFLQPLNLSTDPADYDPIPQYDYTESAEFGDTVYSDRPLAEGYHLNNDLSDVFIVIKVSNNVMNVYYDRNLDTPYTIKHFFADWDYWGYPTGEYVQNLEYCPDTYGVGVTGAVVHDDKEFAVYDGQILRDVGYEYVKKGFDYEIKPNPTADDYLKIEYDLINYATKIDYKVPEGFKDMQTKEGWPISERRVIVVEGIYAVWVPISLGKNIESANGYVEFLTIDREATDPEIIRGLRYIEEEGAWFYVGQQPHQDQALDVVYKESNRITVNYQVNDPLLGAATPGVESYGYLQGNPTGSVASATEAGIFVNWTNEAGEVVSTDPNFVPQRMVPEQDPEDFDGRFPDPPLSETYTANFKPASENVNAQTGDTTAGVVGIVFAMLMLAGVGLFMGMRRRKPVYQGKHCA